MEVFQKVNKVTGVGWREYRSIIEVVLKDPSRM